MRSRIGIRLSLAASGMFAGLAFTVSSAVPLATPAAAQWSTVYEQTYLPATHNWAFRRNYNAAERLFYAFDYGHAILYETLWTRPNAAASVLENDIYNRLTRRILVRPPHVPLEEGAIEIAYAKLAPEAKVMFDWAHVLHRQVYDVWADERIPLEQKDAHVGEILRYYRSRPDIAFSTRPKSMDIMDGHHYSLAFRERYPKFNGLIWAYHWLQIGLYEPLLTGRTADERQALVRATVARFWQMLERPPETMPYLMPMTAAVAPVFAERYPEIAIVFDNLHMMHDVVSDILTSERVPRERKREEILRLAAMFRDDTSYATTVAEWRQMAVGMGVHNQGGPAVGFLASLPEPTVPRGMSMAGMDHAQMQHAGHGEPARAGDEAHAGHPAPAARPQQGHDDHEEVAAEVDVRRLRELHERMMADPMIRRRIESDTALRRLLRELPADTDVRHDTEDATTHRTMEFILRLLANPQVEARIHADPRLHRLWSDPEVQKLLESMRRMHGNGGARHQRQDRE